MAYLIAGPCVALIGIVAVFFVLRRKSVEKRSMYSARRSQFEHKVRAARQRTLTPRGHGKLTAQTIPGDAAPSPFEAGQPTVAYETPAYDAPPVAPPSAPAWSQPQQASGPAPWDVPVSPAATRPPAPAPDPAPAFDYPPPAPPVAPPPEYMAPAYTPAPDEPAPAEQVWTPAPAPSPPASHLEPAASATAASASAAGGWSIVTTEKESAATAAPTAPDGDGKKKDRKGAPATDPSSWQLASGDAPGMQADEPEARRPSGTLVAVAQYAVLVIGLVMVLIGVIVMVANSKVT